MVVLIVDEHSTISILRDKFPTIGFTYSRAWNSIAIRMIDMKGAEVYIVFDSVKDTFLVANPPAKTWNNMEEFFAALESDYKNLQHFKDPVVTCYELLHSGADEGEFDTMSDWQGESVLSELNKLIEEEDPLDKYKYLVPIVNKLREEFPTYDIRFNYDKHGAFIVMADNVYFNVIRAYVDPFLIKLNNTDQPTVHYTLADFEDLSHGRMPQYEKFEAPIKSLVAQLQPGNEADFDTMSDWQGESKLTENFAPEIVKQAQQIIQSNSFDLTNWTFPRYDLIEANTSIRMGQRDEYDEDEEAQVTIDINAWLTIRFHPSMIEMKCEGDDGTYFSIGTNNDWTNWIGADDKVVATIDFANMREVFSNIVDEYEASKEAVAERHGNYAGYEEDREWIELDNASTAIWTMWSRKYKDIQGLFNGIVPLLYAHGDEGEFDTMSDWQGESVLSELTQLIEGDEAFRLESYWLQVKEIAEKYNLTFSVHMNGFFLHFSDTADGEIYISCQDDGTGKLERIGYGIYYHPHGQTTGYGIGADLKGPEFNTWTCVRKFPFDTKPFEIVKRESSQKGERLFALLELIKPREDALISCVHELLELFMQHGNEGEFDTMSDWQGESVLPELDKLIEMRSFDYYAVTYDGEVYCTECLPDGVTVNDEEVYPIFADSEWDYTPVCHKCGAEHDYMNVATPPDDRWEDLKVIGKEIADRHKVAFQYNDRHWWLKFTQAHEFNKNLGTDSLFVNFEDVHNEHNFIDFDYQGNHGTISGLNYNKVSHLINEHPELAVLQDILDELAPNIGQVGDTSDFDTMSDWQGESVLHEGITYEFTPEFDAKVNAVLEPLGFSHWKREDRGEWTKRFEYTVKSKNGRQWDYKSEIKLGLELGRNANELVVNLSGLKKSGGATFYLDTNEFDWRGHGHKFDPNTVMDLGYVYKITRKLPSQSVFTSDLLKLCSSLAKYKPALYKEIKDGYRDAITALFSIWNQIGDEGEFDTMSDWQGESRLTEAQFEYTPEFATKVSEVLSPLGFQHYSNKWDKDIKFHKKVKFTYQREGEPNHYIREERIRLEFQFRTANEITVNLNGLEKSGSITFNVKDGEVWLHKVPFDINRLADFDYFCSTAMQTGETTAVEQLKKICTSLPRYYKAVYKEVKEVYGHAMRGILSLLYHPGDEGDFDTMSDWYGESVEEPIGDERDALTVIASRYDFDVRFPGNAYFQKNFFPNDPYKTNDCPYEKLIISFRMQIPQIAIELYTNDGRKFILYLDPPNYNTLLKYSIATKRDEDIGVGEDIFAGFEKFDKSGVPLDRMNHIKARTSLEQEPIVSTLKSVFPLIREVLGYFYKSGNEAEFDTMSDWQGESIEDVSMSLFETWLKVTKQSTSN